MVSDLENSGAGGVLTAPQDLLISKKPLNDDPQIHFTQPIIQDQGKPLYFRGWLNLTDVDVNVQTMTVNLTVILQMLQPEQPPTLASHSPQPHSNPVTTPPPPTMNTLPTSRLTPTAPTASTDSSHLPQHQPPPPPLTTFILNHHHHHSANITA